LHLMYFPEIQRLWCTQLHFYYSIWLLGLRDFEKLGLIIVTLLSSILRS